MTPQQTTPFLQGDLTPQQSDSVDLRNDNAGSETDQARSIVVRYLESLPAESQTDLESMVGEITKRYPFHGDKEDFFKTIVKSLEDEGWVKSDHGMLCLDKTASVTRQFIFGQKRR